MNFSRTLFQGIKPNISLKRFFSNPIPEPLKDSFGRHHDYLRISLTERCNLRCLYCMPENGITLSPQSNLLTNDEIIKSANLFVKKFGIKKIRLTGGEPLIRKDIVEIVSNLSRLKACGLETISMTTNGILFERYDRSLRQAGLDSVNISLDTLKNDRYLRITRRNGLEKVLSSIEKALENSYESVKINCVLIDGFNQDEIVDFVELTKTKKIEIRFIELMPFIGNNWSKEKMISYSRLMAIIESHYRTDLKRLKPRSMNDTAILYQINGYDGVIGLINSMTKPFCSGCNRIRITADGSIKNCLFGKEEFSLRDAIRNGFDESEITNLIKTSIASKKRSHAGFAKIFNDKSNRPMILIDQRRFYSSDNKCNENEFSHIDTETNRIKMVDVSDKKVTQRNAHARAKIKVSRIVFDKIQSNQIAKGDVLTTAKLAAISAAKMTSHLIPLCHPIPLEHIEVKFQFDPSQNEIGIDVLCRTSSKTGIEMEALVAASIAALTIYDMCKALDKAMIIKECKLIEKTGGKTDFFRY